MWKFSEEDKQGVVGGRTENLGMSALRTWLHHLALCKLLEDEVHSVVV